MWRYALQEPHLHDAGWLELHLLSVMRQCKDSAISLIALSSLTLKILQSCKIVRVFPAEVTFLELFLDNSIGWE